MSELVDQVAAKAGINTDQAAKAVEAVMEQLQSRLPEPIAGQLRGLIEGRAGDAGAAGGGTPDVGEALKGLGGMLGR